MSSSPSPHLMPTYARADLAFERGEGAWLVTTTGRALSRFRRRHRGECARPCASASGRGADRAGRQALAHLQSLSASRARSGWRSGLSTATFADTVFFTNSGAEAIECAIKTARRYHFVERPSGALPHHHLRRRLPRPHAGDASRPAGRQKYLEGFGPKVEGFDQVPFGDHRGASKAAIGAGDRRRS